MLASNKSNISPTSRKSSVDSLVILPSTSTSASDLCISQCSTTSSYADLSSPSRHAASNPGKRASVFNLRSRSNTATSTASTMSVMPANMAAFDISSRRSSQDLRHLAGQSFMDMHQGRRSLFRGKKAKRLSGSTSFSIGEMDEGDAGAKRGSVLRKNKRPNLSIERSTSNLKQRISSPFDFQHLTHTDRHQFAALQQASESELEVEFSAVRASQVPRRNLTGIKAQDLDSMYSPERLGTPESRSASALGFRSPPASPSAKEEQSVGSSTEDDLGPGLRLSRSVESFSRPGVNPRMHRHTQSANPPPRMSSRMPLDPVADEQEEHHPRTGPLSPNTRGSRQSGLWDSFAPLSPVSTGGQLPTMLEEESDYVGHAFTTPDNSACHPMTPLFSPGLEDVAEEPERFVDPRPAPMPPLRSPASPRSPTFESFSFISPRSPIGRSQSRKSLSASPKAPSQRSSMTRPLSQASDTLGSPTMMRRCSIRRAPTNRRRSNTWRVLEESWEDDIDYIYDNALEADCDFDWDRTSVEDATEDRDRTPEQQDHMSSAASRDSRTVSLDSEEGPAFRAGFYADTDRPLLQLPSINSVPELEARSAISTSTAETSVHTPSELYIPQNQYSFDGFSLTPSLLVPQDFKDQMSREDMYTDLLADYEEGEDRFPFLEASQSVSSSTRSSHVRSSKRSSYDSSLMSSGLGSGSWTLATRRSASSAGSHGSLPELVHSSRNTRRDFSTVVDCLSEQVASLASFNDDVDENDDEVTPPGNGSHDRTFFAPSEEQQRPVPEHLSIEAEVRSSLELARRGSTQLPRSPLHSHKYASSDGAAKLLASATQGLERQSSTKSRSRAASSGVTQRKEYLSLFPTPPTHSPLASPTTTSGRPFGSI